MGSFGFFYRKSIALLTCYYHIIIINKWLSGKAENIDPYCLFSTISLYFPLKLSWEMLWLCKTPRYLNQTFKSYIKYLYVTDIFRKKKTLILRLSGLMLNNLYWILIYFENLNQFNHTHNNRPMGHFAHWGTKGMIKSA